MAVLLNNGRIGCKSLWFQKHAVFETFTRDPVMRGLVLGVGGPCFDGVGS